MIDGSPNTARQVVLLMTDTTRWDMLGCYRSHGIRTPFLDDLASDGLRFNRAYPSSPLCAPARSTLFTGTWPHTNGVWTNGYALGLDSRTIGQRLQDRGLSTAYVGKWHLDGTDYFGSGRPAPGWDPAYWYDGRNYLDDLSPIERRRSRDPGTNDDPGLTAEFTFAHRCSDRAIEFLARHGHNDFLLVVSYDEPHHPSISPRPYSTMYRDLEFTSGPDGPDGVGSKPELQALWAEGHPIRDPQARQAYRTYLLGAQTFVDAEIGRVLEAVDKFAPDAMVLYTSDHGDALQSHRLWAKGPAIYDEIARVPLIVRWPGRIPAGSVDEHPISHIDIAPTLLDVFGLDTPPFLPGASLIPVLTGTGRPASEYVFVEFGRYDMDPDGFGGLQLMRAVFDGRHKLSVNLLDTDELYDLEADPHEMVNLIDSPAHTDARNRLHDRLLTWMHDTRDPFRGYQWEGREWRNDARSASWSGWGLIRPRPDDGYAKRVIDYFTGQEMSETSRGPWRGGK